MKVLVVGGAGYIGSHVCKSLLRRGAVVTVFDNLSSGLRGNLLPGSAFRHGDILEPRALDEACASAPGGGAYDGVIHLAALKAAGESMTAPEKYSVHNITGSINLLNAAVRHGIRHFVFSSTAAVYGDPEYLPMDEKHPTRPVNYYGYTKLAIEGYLDWYSRLKGLRYAALRYFNAAGYDVDGELCGLEQNPANLLPVVMEAAMGWRPGIQIFGDDYDTRDGTGMRDYIHVTDLARAHVMALERLLAGGASMTVNLGTGDGITVKEMARKAMEVSGNRFACEVAGRRAGDPATVIASAGLARELLGWVAEHSDVDTLVRTTWKAYQANAASRRT